MFGNESYIFRTLLKWSNNIISTAFLPGLLSASCSDQSHGHNNRFTYRYWGKHEEHFVKGCRDVLDTVTCRFGKTHLRKFYFIYFLEVVYFLDRQNRQNRKLQTLCAHKQHKRRKIQLAVSKIVLSANKKKATKFKYLYPKQRKSVCTQRPDFCEDVN